MENTENYERLLAAHADLTAGRYVEARRVFEELSLSGDKQAYLYLGSMQERGLGGPVDKVKAASYYKVSCDSGNATACFFLGLLKFKNHDFEGSLDPYRKAADAGHPAAAYWVAQIYGDSTNPLADRLKEMYYLEVAAREGHIFAARDLAKRHMFDQRTIGAKLCALGNYIRAIFRGLLIIAKNADDPRVQ